MIGSTSFLYPLKIQSLQMGAKSEKNYWDKTTLPFLTFLFFIFFIYTFLTFPLQRCFLFFFAFLFCFDFSFVMMLFVFLFFYFFVFFFLWFCEAVGSSSFPSFFFFFLNFIFIIFLKKTLLDNFLFYFLKCSISFDKFIRTLFLTKPKSFLYFYFSNLSTKHKWKKLKTFLSSYFSILSLYFYSLTFLSS